MLQSIHDKLHGWVAYVVLGAIAGSFIFWGINWTLAAPNYAAKVNGREISINDVRQAYQSQLAQAQRKANGNLDDKQRNAIKQEILDEFVGTEALITRIDSLGYRVSDQELQDEMAKIPAFQVNGKFDAAHAVAILKSQGRSVEEIEGMIRRQVQLGQLDSAMRASTFVTPSEIKRLNGLTRQQRELAWIVVPAAHYAAEAVPDDAAIAAYYEQHKGEYLSPETVNLRYVEIGLAQLETHLTLTDAQLQTYFEEQKAKNPEAFTQPEQRRVSHILIQASTPKDEAAAQAKAEDLLKRIQAGEDFAKLAKENSQDPGSAPQGGDLGWSERKVWVAPFADAAYSMKVGEIRGPVKTQFGYHILKLVGVQEATTKTFEQSRTDLESDYRRSEAERQFNSLQDELADAALQSATDIDAVARKAGLPVQQIVDFSRNEGGGALGKSPKAIEAAFSQEALDGRVSSIVEIEKGRGIVLKASDHKLPQQLKLEAVRTELIKAWKEQRGRELASAAAADAAKRLAAGESWDAIAKRLGAPLQAPHFVGRTDEAVPLDVRRLAFDLPKPTDKPQFRAVPVDGGNAAVFGLSAVREDPNTNPQQIDFARHEFANEAAAAEAESYSLAARAAAKVLINPQAIE
ncbi:MAG TPA: SurA N-terminal domain-containing protein [Steroidobacteraceae bacterium]|nr:SurA N-terminal domain-containing protein [Steroidobacteraceae bacterium]